MLKRSTWSVLLMAIVLVFVTFNCGARDWASCPIMGIPSYGPDTVIVDTEGIVHIYNSSSNWICNGNLNQEWQIQYITQCDVVCLNITTEENEVHAAFICSDGNVFYQWRKPDTSWQVELVESFRPESIERVEIERSPDGTLWLAVLYNDNYYLYEHTQQGWNDYVVETMPAQFKDQSLWRFEIDWNNDLHLVRQISPIGFYEVSGTPGNWSGSIINNIEEFPGDSLEFELRDMEMRKDNTPVLHVSGTTIIDRSTQGFCGAVFQNNGDWEAAETWLNYYGKTAYDHARDRIHCADRERFGDGRYWSVPLGPESRVAYSPDEDMSHEGVCCMTVDKLDLPNLVVYNGAGFKFYCPRADISLDVTREESENGNLVNYGCSISNWKWERSARLGFVIEIAGNLYWWKNWSANPYLETVTIDTGRINRDFLLIDSPRGDYGIDVTFYTALLHPDMDIFLNDACWDMLTVTY